MHGSPPVHGSPPDGRSWRISRLRIPLVQQDDPHDWALLEFGVIGTCGHSTFIKCRVSMPLLWISSIHEVCHCGSGLNFPASRQHVQYALTRHPLRGVTDMWKEMLDKSCTFSAVDFGLTTDLKILTVHEWHGSLRCCRCPDYLRGQQISS